MVFSINRLARFQDISGQNRNIPISQLKLCGPPRFAGIHQRECVKLLANDFAIEQSD